MNEQSLQKLPHLTANRPSLSRNVARCSCRQIWGLHGPTAGGEPHSPTTTKMEMLIQGAPAKLSGCVPSESTGPAREESVVSGEVVLKRWPGEGAAAAVGLGRTGPDESVQQQGGRNPFKKRQTSECPQSWNHQLCMKE